MFSTLYSRIKFWSHLQEEFLNPILSIDPVRTQKYIPQNSENDQTYKAKTRDCIAVFSSADCKHWASLLVDLLELMTQSCSSCRRWFARHFWTFFFSLCSCLCTFSHRRNVFLQSFHKLSIWSDKYEGFSLSQMNLFMILAILS